MRSSRSLSAHPGRVGPVVAAPVALLVVDHDGTISRLRDGWPEIAVRVMTRRVPRGAARTRAHEAAREIVRGGGGEPVGRIMARHAAAAGLPGDVADAVERYERWLGGVVARRSAGGEATAWLVPGMADLIRAAAGAGIRVLVLSGSPREVVTAEIAAFGLGPFVEAVLGSAGPDDPHFAKGPALAGWCQAHGIDGRTIVGIGDGVVETAAVSDLGGIALGMAPPGDPERLRAAGALVTVADGHGLAVVPGPGIALVEAAG